jgi:hypothetical protein
MTPIHSARYVFLLLIVCTFPSRLSAADQFQTMNDTLSILRDYSHRNLTTSNDVPKAIQQLAAIRNAVTDSGQELPEEYLQPFDEFVTAFKSAADPQPANKQKELVDHIIRDIDRKNATRDALGAGLAGAVPVEISVTVVTLQKGREVNGYIVRANPAYRGLTLPEKYLWNETDTSNPPKRNVILGQKLFFVMKDGKTVAQTPVYVGGAKVQTVKINIE